MGGGMDDLLGLLGGSPAPAPAAPAGMDAMMAMMGGPAMSMGAAPAAPPGSFQAWSKDGLQIMFMATKDPSNPSVTRVEATFNNSTGGDMEGLNFQVAVPKYMQLQMKPPSSTAVTAGSSGSVKQLFQLANSMHGQKPIVLRVKIDYNTMGRAVSETGQVDNFPPGF
jgi:AP-1 complex subunit gamma-1